MALSWKEVPEAMHCLHCTRRHMEDLRDSVQVQRGRVRGNTPEGADFFFFFLTEVMLVFFFVLFF